MSPARVAAWRALLRMRATGARLDESLAGLPELESLDERDRALATELVSGTLKRRLSLDAVLGEVTKTALGNTDPEVLEALRVAAYQLLFLDRVPAYAAVDDAVAMIAGKGRRTQGFANAVLRQVAAEGRARLAALSDGDDTRAWEVRYSCPRWIVQRARRDLGDGVAAGLLGAAAGAPERCLRVNRVKCDLADAQAALTAAGFAVEGVPGLPDALLYDGPSLERSLAFRQGEVTPQSRGSQMVAMVAVSGGHAVDVLDLCAAPGTKTAHVAALLPGARLTAVDVDEARVTALRANLQRLGVEGVTIVRGDALDLGAEHDGAYDAVVLDAPCSGLGTLASRADVRWRRRASDVPRLADLQKALLRRAARCVRPGGTLTYAVCTWPRAETLAVVGSLLGDGRWQVDDLSVEWPGVAHPAAGGHLLVLPPEHGSTVFFIARLRRIGDVAG